MLEVFHLHIGHHSVVLYLLCALESIELTCAEVFHLHIGHHSVVLYLPCALGSIELTCAGSVSFTYRLS